MLGASPLLLTSEMLTGGGGDGGGGGGCGCGCGVARALLKTFPSANHYRHGLATAVAMDERETIYLVLCRASFLLLV